MIREYDPPQLRLHGYRPDLRFEIVYAPPRAHISSEMLTMAMEGDTTMPYITVTGDELDVLTLTDDFGHRYIYRLGDYNALYDAFEMEWPD